MASDLSVRPSPGSVFTVNEEIIDVETNGLHLELAPFGLEHVYDYEPDGHHPVHLGDVYGNNGRYRVIHKLGSGGFATVWLCRDTEAKGPTKYVALKILMAETYNDECPELRVNQLEDALSQHIDRGNDAGFICLPLDHFKIHGPNGDHISFVYPVLGPNVSLGLCRTSEDPDRDLRRIGLEVTKAVKFLHSQGICHGDLTPSNILHRITGLDGLDEDEVLKILGNPVLNPVLDASQEQHHETTAPNYLVYPVNWSDVDTQFISQESCLIDFGESFSISQPPSDLGIPGPYRSPELILDKSAGVGFGSDIWALGCSLFEIRTGRKLFCPFDDEDNEYLCTFVQVLGKLPEPWWSETWEDRRRMYKDDVDEKGLVVAAQAYEPGNNREEKKDYTVTIHPSVADGARSLEDMIAPGLWYMSDHRPNGDHHRDISKTEQKVFADLLRRLLEYRPEARISTEDAVKHEWFRL
ncbi:kinase-like protein [Cadophora sp. DSE1049]|nr:kinase-like protein [Cadophora sp. DSE1049]